MRMATMSCAAAGPPSVTDARSRSSPAKAPSPRKRPADNMSLSSIAGHGHDDRHLTDSFIATREFFEGPFGQIDDVGRRGPKRPRGLSVGTAQERSSVVDDGGNG